MAARVIAGLFAATMFVIVGIFMFAWLRPPPAGAPGPDLTSQTVTERVGPFMFTAVATINSGVAEIAVSARDAVGRPVTPSSPPTVVLRMEGMDMPSQPVRLQAISEGGWHGSARPNMAGTWSFVVFVGTAELVVPLLVPP